MTDESLPPSAVTPSAVAPSAVTTSVARPRLPALPDGVGPLALSVLLFGSAWPVTKYALIQGAQPLWFAEGRAAFSGLTAAVLLALLGRLRRPGRADLPALLAVGLLQLTGFFALSHAAVAWVPAGRTAVLANVTTVWIAPLSLLVLREAVPPRRWAAAALGLAGVAVLMGPWAIDWRAPHVLLGHVFLLGAALCWSLAILTLRRFPPRLPMLALLPWCFGLAAVALLPLPLMLEPHPGPWNAGAWAAMAFIGLLAGPGGTWCVLLAAAALPAMASSVGFLGMPAVGVLLSALWLGERVGPDLLLGAALILGGVLLGAWPAGARRRRRHA